MVLLGAMELLNCFSNQMTCQKHPAADVTDKKLEEGGVDHSAAPFGLQNKYVEETGTGDRRVA